MVPQGRANQAAAPSLWQPLASFPTRQLSPYPGKHPISRSGSLATYPATAPLPTPASTPFPEEEAHLPTYQPTYPATRVEAHLPTRQLLPYLPGKHPNFPPKREAPLPGKHPICAPKEAVPTRQPLPYKWILFAIPTLWDLLAYPATNPFWPETCPSYPATSRRSAGLLQ